MITDSKPERPATDLQILCFSIVTDDIFKSTVNPIKDRSNSYLGIKIYNSILKKIFQSTTVL